MPTANAILRHRGLDEEDEGASGDIASSPFPLSGGILDTLVHPGDDYLTMHSFVHRTTAAAGRILKIPPPLPGKKKPTWGTIRY